MASDLPRISILCSGSGSNLQAIIDNCANGRIPGQIVRVTTNRKNVRSETRAKEAGIPTQYFNMIAEGFVKKDDDEAQKLEGRKCYDAALAPKILADKPDLVVLAGWMHIFTTEFLLPLEKAGVPVINLHPALPGRYDGAGAIQRAYDDYRAGKLENNTTGIMIHYVIKEVDRGDPIEVEEIVIQEGETLDQLNDRMHAHEHELVVRATEKLCRSIAEKKSLAASSS